MKPDCEYYERRNHQQDSPGSQLDVGREEGDGDDDHGQTLHGELGQAVLKELLEVLDIARHATHQDAGFFFREEVQAESLEMSKYFDAQVVHHA